MRYLIDGHNLVPRLGLRLDSLDDEEQLISRLQDFCRLRRAQVEVFFDGAPPGHPSTRKQGAVTAHFIRKGTIADAAIEKRLAGLGKDARNLTVISSDGRVQAAARAAHAAALTSDDFARQVNSAGRKEAASKPEASSAAELADWERLFGTRKK